jgi:hypothetical protein
MIRKSSVFILISGLIVGLVACGSGNNGGGGGSGAVTANITASPTTVDLGETVKLTWSSTNATSCLATSAPAESDWTAIVANSGSATVTPGSYAGEVYSLTCAGSGSSSATASASITVNSAAAGIVNGRNGQQPSTVWAGQSCVFDGYSTANLTVLGASGSGQIGVNFPVLGGLGGGYGGYWGGWSATGDGTGLLIDYAPNSNSCGKVQFPVSILNIDGSTASGSFSGGLVDQFGATTSCSFKLVPAGGYFEVGPCEDAQQDSGHVRIAKDDDGSRH